MFLAGIAFVVAVYHAHMAILLRHNQELFRKKELNVWLWLTLAVVLIYP